MDLLSKLKTVFFAARQEAGEFWADALVRAFEEEAMLAPPRFRSARGSPDRFAAGRLILARDGTAWVELVPAVYRRLKNIREQDHRDWWDRSEPLKGLLSVLLRPRLPFSQDQLAAVIEFCAANASHVSGTSFQSLLRQAKQFEGALGEALAASMVRLSAAAQPWGARGRDLAEVTQRVIATAKAGRPVFLDSPWVRRLNDAIARLPEQSLVVAQCALDAARRSGKACKPSRALLNAARTAVAAESELAAWFLDQVEAYDPCNRDPNEDAIRALIWMASVGDEAMVAPRIGAYCELCFKKIPDIGAPSIKLGNAAIQALALLGGDHAIAALARLKSRIRYPRVVRRIDGTLGEIALRLGVSPEELEESSLPTYDLSVEGERRLPVGDTTAIIRVVGTREVQLRWVRADRRETAALPKDLKETAPDAVAATRRLRKEIEATLAGQLSRFEALYLKSRDLPFAQWRDRYLRHPLLAGLARRLIWRFETDAGRIAGLPRSGAIEGVDGRPIDESRCTSATLWHPLHSTADHVLAWRQRLAALAITQPFKQAHREIYVVTDAELQSDIYSNRFAGHILRQHQFKALCGQRGWQYHLMGEWDFHNTPTRVLPGHRLSIEFWVQQIEGELSRTGVATLMSTDQVRFVGVDGGPVRLATVPPLVFSELMRDVDLFVGVASVGNDPHWFDRGPEPRFGAYWQSYAFGDLGQSAKTRGEVLATLLSSLTIADRCELQERFLIVRGKKRTYKIYLGSANIQMAPNDQYLCIVPGHGLLGARCDGPSLHTSVRRRHDPLCHPVQGVPPCGRRQDNRPGDSESDELLVGCGADKALSLRPLACVATSCDPSISFSLGGLDPKQPSGTARPHGAVVA